MGQKSRRCSLPRQLYLQILDSRLSEFTSNVAIEFGLVRSGRLTAGSYNSTILYRTGHGYTPGKGPAGSFNGSDWATTVTATTHYIASYEFEFTSHNQFDYLLVTRAYYDGPVST